MTAPKASHDYVPGGLPEALEFLKRLRWELRPLWRARLYRDRLQIYDVNHDYFELRGVGFPDADIVAILRAINANFDPDTIHDAPVAEYRELDTGRCYTWAQDRVM